VSDDLKTVLLYRDRGWSEVETPLQFGDDDYEWSQILDRNGWLHATTLGAADGISVDLYQRRPDERSSRYPWLVEYNTTSLCKTIVIERWQDLIDFLAHVSSTMIAAVLPGDTAYVLDDFFEKSPHRAEKRKHSRWESLTSKSGKQQTAEEASKP
jgi:hypothetical protein